MKIKKFTWLILICSILTFLVGTGVRTFGSSIDHENNDEKVVYLTFDDGPTPHITEKILDILKENNIKATFFVVGKEIIEREAILKRIYEEGHSIGIHTYSHSFSKIYRSENAFIEELEKTSCLIESILGYKPCSVRFPGGSDKMLTQEFLDRLHEKGYMVYDWNVNLEDGLDGGISVGKIIKNSKIAKGNKSVRFILAHCNSNNKNTCRALPAIIDYYKNEGFEFKTIDKTTKEYYYKFRKHKGAGGV